MVVLSKIDIIVKQMNYYLKNFLEELVHKIDKHLKINKYKVSSYNLKKEIKEIF